MPQVDLHARTGMVGTQQPFGDSDGVVVQQSLPFGGISNSLPGFLVYSLAIGKNTSLSSKIDAIHRRT